MSKEIERYPDPSKFDQKLYDDILSLPNDQQITLSFLKEHVWPQVETFSIPKEKIIKGMQANMFNIMMMDKDGEERSVMVKRIVPMELPEKPSREIWQGFVSSVRTEIDFYKDLLKPENVQIRPLFPQIFTSLGTGHAKDDMPMETSFSIIMQDLSSAYIQKPMMTKGEAILVMESLARLHAHYWNKVDPSARRGSFWVLERRKAFSEVENADKTWNEFVDRFPELEQIHDDVRTIGSLLASKAKDLDKLIDDCGNTLVHGDAKGWNFFFAKDQRRQDISSFLFIDMQWAGRGHPFQDVAYSLTTTSDEECLEQMDDLVDYYIDNLDKRLQENGVQGHDMTKLRSQYDQVWLDYARVIVSGLWKRLNPQSMEANKSKVGPSMINRSMAHVLFITKRLCRLLL